jgi:hypothetical protein
MKFGSSKNIHLSCLLIIALKIVATKPFWSFIFVINSQVIGKHGFFL